MEIGEFQRRMRALYGAKDAARGPDATFLYFVAEVGELAEACREPQRHDLAGEFADCFAWLVSLADLHGIDLEAAVARKYPAVCRRCGSSPCACSGKP
ncbi:MAG: MazG nucleotide pyrophosphohydrolase domain-containing protein [Planctomycetota bacterium]|nr:nucleotide pyrophosphohydrolase [Planctomycetota bacterium]MCX8039631.1 nucleotide pyrophosphohydrolase [Planctomycetota bacterium]MDW8372930.1 MazG nucleotide pyrophosphohydrolase domain-containing protein [Planctomycetota bacterium]